MQLYFQPRALDHLVRAHDFLAHRHTDADGDDLDLGKSLHGDLLRLGQRRPGITPATSATPIPRTSPPAVHAD